MQGSQPHKHWANLGLAISGATLQPGEHRSLREIAAYCQAAIEEMAGVEDSHYSWQAISQMEQKALKKLRIKMQFHKDPFLVEAVNTYCKK